MRKLFFFLLILFLIPIVSAQPTCSDGSKVVWAQKEIKEGNMKTINSLGVGLVAADEVTALRKILADVILEAKLISLTNETNSQGFKLAKGSYTINLINATDNAANIKIGSEIKLVSSTESEMIGGLYVILKSLETTGPDAPKVDLIIGSSLVSLSSDANPSEKVTFVNDTYVIDLVTASDVDATIRVNTCDTGDLVEETLEVANTTETVETNLTLEDPTNTNNTLNQSGENLTSNESGPPQVVAKGVFGRFVAWLKKYFSGFKF